MSSPLCLVSGHTSGTLLTRSSDLCFHANSGTGGAWVVGAASLVSTNSGTSGVEGFSEDHIQFSPRLKRELAVISHAVLEKQVLIARTHSRPPPPRSSPTTPRPHPDPLDQQVNCVGNVHTPNTQTVTRVENNGNVSKPVIIRFNGGSSRPIDHVGDITILVGVTHPVPRRLLSHCSLDEERGVGAVLVLKSHHILQVRVKDIIPE